MSKMTLSFFRKTFIVSVLFLSTSFVLAQSNRDTLVLVNGDRIIGSLKEVSQGKVNFKVAYSNSNFNIDWEDVAKIASNDNFIFTFKTGVRINGVINDANLDSLQIDILDVLLKPKRGNHDLDSRYIWITKDEMVHLERVEDGFFKRLDGEISLGANLAKANRLRQYSVRSNLNYTGGWFAASLSFNAIRALQDETDPISRSDGGIALIGLLKNEWFVITRGNFLSNTEQLIDFRFDYKTALGRYLIFRPKAKLFAQAGVNFNFEKFTLEPEINKSSELVYGFGINFLDFGPFMIQGTLLGFTGLSEGGRFRSDSKLDIKYEFLDDFFIKFGTTFNYDNQATEGASNYDYIIQSTLGWSF